MRWLSGCQPLSRDQLAGTKLMPKIIDLTGQRFGRLVAMRPTDERRRGCRVWLCQCDCGLQKAFTGIDLRRCDSKSCGCIVYTRKHGHAREGGRTPTYCSWQGMINRCTRPTHNRYSRYGGRGIKVCERWLSSFENFLADLGEKPAGMSLDRIKTDGDYEPGNCRWATSGEQARNTSRNVMLTAFGKTQCVMAWASECGISYSGLVKRLKKGMTVEEAVSMPVKGR